MESIAALTAKQTLDMLKEFPQSYNNLYVSSEDLQRQRNEKIRLLLKYATLKSPWYKKCLSHIDIEQFTEQDLPEIPVMNKNILMNNWDEIVTDPRLSLKLVEQHLKKINEDENLLYLFDRYHVITTSGSSGIRGTFIYDWNEWNLFYIHLLRYGLYYPDKTKIINEAKITKAAIVNIINPIFATYSLHKTFNLNNTEKYHFPITLPINQIIAGLNSVQPEIIIALPPTVHQLCQEAIQGRLVIQPRVVNTFGEPLNRTTRQLIKNTWPNVAIFNTYSSSEGLIGVNCCADSQTIHLNDDACIVEPVDEWGNRVEKGKMSNKIYLTNLYNYTLPLIRYEIPDQLIFLDKTCDCGINHQLINEPLYRPEYDFTYPNNILIHHSVFDTPLLLEKNLREFQVIQTANGVDVKIIPTGYINKTRLRDNICAELSQFGLKNPIVNLIEVEKLITLGSGKLRRFIKYHGPIA